MSNLKLKNVSLAYKRNILALNDISLTIGENKIVGLVGKNGAGKTSLLSLIAGFRRASVGEILLDEENIYENQNATSRISFIWNRSFTDESFKVKSFFKNCRLLRPDWDHEYALSLADKFNIPLNARVRKLSSGIKASLNVISGLASRAPVTIFDEAYLGMDAVNRKLFYTELLNDYMKNPRTIIFSTHYISEVEHLFEEIILLDKGRLICSEPVEKFVEKGTTVLGETSEVERFSKITGKRVLNQETLGNTSRFTLFGNLSETERSLAAEKGLQLSQPNLQDLFISLISENGEREAENEQ